jgi:hypothetical protein
MSKPGKLMTRMVMVRALSAPTPVYHNRRRQARQQDPNCTLPTLLYVSGRDRRLILTRAYPVLRLANIKACF